MAFVDTYAIFSDENGAYSDYLPDRRPVSSSAAGVRRRPLRPRGRRADRTPRGQGVPQGVRPHELEGGAGRSPREQREIRLDAVILRLVLLAAVLVLAAGARAAPDRTVYHNGDSLAVGTTLYLDRHLPGWQIATTTSVSRHAWEGAAMVRSIGPSLPRVLVIQLGTNDPPAGVAVFRRSVRRVLRAAGPGRCVVWTTILRPPYEGVSYERLNRVLFREAARRPNLRVVDWVGVAERHPAWFGPDGVHPTMDGDHSLAAAIAREVRRCSPGS